MEHEGDGDTICSWSTWKHPQEYKKETGRTCDEKKNQVHPDHNTTKTRLDT